jgi:ABC-type nitrate/sulfonate/bicarbonate transport system ATPase subunit
MINFKNVTISFDGLNVLNNISFGIGANEIVAVLGPSGSGKTTLLKLISGILRPDSGTIGTSSRRMGYVFQDHRLLPWRTAADNIALVLKAAGLTQEEASKKALFWLDRLGLKGYAGYYPGQLSGGMVQRVSIARAFAIQPEIMLMDEPLSNLDMGLADSLLRDLKGVLADYRSTTVYVTHEYVEALTIADRIFHLERQTLKETIVTDRKAMLRDYLTQRYEGFGLNNGT